VVAKEREGNDLTMIPTYQQPIPTEVKRQQQPQQPGSVQRTTFTKDDYAALAPRTTVSYGKPNIAAQSQAPATQQPRASAPQVGGALPMPAYATNQSQAAPSRPATASGNAANSPYGRPPSFTSTMTDAYGQSTTPDQFYPQQDAFIAQLVNRMGQIPGGTWLGQGPPPADFGRRPDMNFGEMWNQGGQMVNDGWRNPFSPGIAQPIQPPPQGTPYQPGVGGGFPDAPPLMPIDMMRPTYDGATGNLKRPSRPLPEPTYQGLPPRGPSPAPIGDGPLQLPANIPFPAQDFSRFPTELRSYESGRLPGLGMAQPIQPPSQGMPYRPAPRAPASMPAQEEMPPLLTEDDFWKSRHQLHFQSKFDKNFDPHGVSGYRSHADYVDGTQKKRDMWRNAQVWPTSMYG
jgi:hypothetical protein